MKYLEIAQGSPRNRGFLVQYDKLSHYIRSDEALYRSFYTYDDTAVKVVEQTQSLKKFVGARGVDKVVIDIDKGDNSDIHTLNFLISTVFELEERGLSRKSKEASRNEVIDVNPLAAAAIKNELISFRICVL